MATFRLFVQDVGKVGYSGFSEVIASDQTDALRIARKIKFQCRAIVLPESRRDLWPDGKTGAVSSEALRLGAVNFDGGN